MPKKGAHADLLITQRPPAMGTNGAVSSPHYLATQTGQEVLKKGGHAVDAAIAMNAVLCVVYPHMAGLGGDLFSLVWDKETNKVEALNGSGRSGEKASIEFYKSKNLKEIPTRGVLSANTVPGTVSAWKKLHDRYGKLSWESLFENSIHYARDGFPISEKLCEFVFQHEKLLRGSEETEKVYFPDGSLPSAGTRFIQKDLAESLRKISVDGPDVFYNGELGEKIISSLQNKGGILTKGDLASHTSEWQEPISTQYRDLEIFELKPNTQGMAALMILNLLENYDFAGMGDHTAQYYHLMTEATKLAFFYRDRWVTDPEKYNIPLEKLLSKEFGDHIRNQLSMEAAASVNRDDMPRLKTNKDTTYMCAADEDGNVCSLIQSIYHEFGSGIMPEGTGILLQNRGSFFSLNHDHPNSLEPEKRTFHTIIPAMAMKNGKPYMLYGSMGGEGQPQTQAALLTRVVDFGYNIQQAIEAPRWLFGRTWGAESDSLKLEGRISDGIAFQLQQLGHKIEKTENWSQQMGHAQGIILHQESGVYEAGADPRGDGLALSW